MPNQPSKDRVRILLRLQNQIDKDRIDAVVKRLNKENPGANYTLQSFCVAAIMDAVKKNEQK